MADRFERLAEKVRYEGEGHMPPSPDAHVVIEVIKMLRDAERGEQRDLRVVTDEILGKLEDIYFGDATGALD